MVVSAALLIRERGAHATAISDVLEHSGAPRGSAYHYFPGGRAQLLREAIDYSADHVATRISGATSGVDVLDGLIHAFRERLRRTDFRAGCPVVAVAVEAGDPQRPDSMPSVTERAGAAFTRWTDLITTRLVSDGVARPRAAELAILMTAAIEGAIVIARTTRDLEPLDAVHRLLRAQLVAETSERNRSHDQ
jgi:AcrR family transcriptional regulator